MANQMFLTDDDHHNLQQQHAFASSSIRDVSYSCGSCGYELNLSSSDRNTSTIDSKYGKSIKTGMISFYSIDESRFTQVDKVQCMPFFFSKQSWGFLRPRTKLLCRKCGNHVGIAYDDNNITSSPYPISSSGSDSTNEITTRKKYNVKIRALQPLSIEES